MVKERGEDAGLVKWPILGQVAHSGPSGPFGPIGSQNRKNSIFFLGPKWVSIWVAGLLESF